jgi:elongator complex protein 3
LRAASCGYDARAQVEMRIRILSQMGHSADKIELIIMGGTFLATPVEYQYRFIKECYEGMNGCTAASLEEAKQINETAVHRCIGLCIETRPDWCTREHISRMLDFGTTRVELGVQTIDDEIFQLVGRGHGVKEVVEATRLLKNYGIKVYYHWMPGLPGSNLQHDLQMSRALFSDENYRPDGIKLYPTLVIRGTELEQWYNEGRYLPYTMDELVDLLVRIKSEIPVYVRIPRLMRDIPTSS